MKHITSRDNSLYKQLRKLADSSRERRKLGQVLLDGAHLLTAYLEVFGQPEMLVMADGALAAEVMQLLQRMPDVEHIVLPPAMFAQLSPVATPTGILALAATPQLPCPGHPVFCLLLEDIQSPGNLGSILRSAAAAGVDAVYLSAGCADAWSPKTLRGGQGAHFVVPIIEGADLLRVAAAFDGRTLATDLSGASLYSMDLTTSVAFMIGNEGAGLSPGLLESASQRVRIPMPGRVESLNAAAAAAICLFERVRQLGV